MHIYKDLEMFVLDESMATIEKGYSGREVIRVSDAYKPETIDNQLQVKYYEDEERANKMKSEKDNKTINLRTHTEEVKCMEDGGLLITGTYQGDPYCKARKWILSICKTNKFFKCSKKPGRMAKWARSSMSAVGLGKPLCAGPTGDSKKREKVYTLFNKEKERRSEWARYNLKALKCDMEALQNIKASRMAVKSCKARRNWATARNEVIDRSRDTKQRVEQLVTDLKVMNFNRDQRRPSFVPASGSRRLSAAEILAARKPYKDPVVLVRLLEEIRRANQV